MLDAEGSVRTRCSQRPRQNQIISTVSVRTCLSKTDISPLDRVVKNRVALVQCGATMMLY
jgi:hypothetical protein